MLQMSRRCFFGVACSALASNAYADNFFDDVVSLSKICNNKYKDYTKTINDALLNYGSIYLDVKDEIAVENIFVPSGGALIGRGSSVTTIRQIKGASGPAIFCGDKNSSRVMLRGFSLVGSNNKNNGIVVDNKYPGISIAKASKFGHQDARNIVDDIFVFDFGGSGLISMGKGASFFSNIWVYNVGGNGIEINSFDSDWKTIDCGLCGLSGVYMGPYCANNRITNIKSWYTGMISSNTNSAGIYIDGAFRNNISNIEVQNHNNVGVLFNSANNINFNSFIIEGPSNNKMKNIGIEINNSRDMIFSGIVGDRDNSSSMVCGVKINESSNIIMNIIANNSDKMREIDVINSKKIICTINGSAFNY